tara:strand:- start:247 stop:609 length:363 start_codon:yes stop_codon:yes gene_type:complete
MKRLLLPLLAALALPTAVNANTFPELKGQPKNFQEWFFIGGSHSHGATLCSLWAARQAITFETAISYRDSLISESSEVSKRFKELAIAGFNAGIDDIQKVHSRNPRLKDLNRKCDSLKIK